MEESKSSKVVNLKKLLLNCNYAIFADWLTIAICLLCVILVYLYSESKSSDSDLYIALIALVLGFLGTLTGGPYVTGLIRNWRYIVIYTATIILMMLSDITVRLFMGGDIPMVFTNWAVLIGSASAVNLFLINSFSPWASSWIEKKNVSSFPAKGMLFVILMQVLQIIISVAGAGIPVVIVQIVMRRILILPITHCIARVNYGSYANELLLKNATLKYVATRSIADSKGFVKEEDPIEQCVIGNILLKLPILGGESMSAGRKSAMLIFDKFIFLEQILAFSSPTMVVGHTAAVGHISFLQLLVSLDGEPSEINPDLQNYLKCKQKVSHFLKGNKKDFMT